MVLLLVREHSASDAVFGVAPRHSAANTVLQFLHCHPVFKFAESSVVRVAKSSQPVLGYKFLEEETQEASELRHAFMLHVASASRPVGL